MKQYGMKRTLDELYRDSGVDPLSPDGRVLRDYWEDGLEKVSWADYQYFRHCKPSFEPVDNGEQVLGALYVLGGILFFFILVASLT